MNKEEYKKSLHRHYPEEPDNVLELAWHFHGMKKAKKYIKLLETCNHNADLAIKAIRAMYVSCDIDAVKAVSEKFITVLLPFTCMEKTAKPHSVTFHVRKMLDDCDVRLSVKQRKLGYDKPVLPGSEPIVLLELRCNHTDPVPNR